jgi:GAF domain-containing protein
MSISIIAESVETKEEKYETLLGKIETLIEEEEDFVANVSNITSTIKDSFEEFSWVGFYFVDRRTGGLVLGPFQGKTARTRIDKGTGVCGSVLERKQTVVVEDVNEFQGHIFCDPESKSEIVIPIIKDGAVTGVLDIDSNRYSAFNNLDKMYLEELIQKISHIF